MTSRLPSLSWSWLLQPGCQPPACSLNPPKYLNLRSDSVRQSDVIATAGAKLTMCLPCTTERASLSGWRSVWRRGRKRNPERRALPHPAIDLDAPAVAIDDAVDDRQAQP